MRYVLNLIYLLLIVVVSPWLVWQAIRKGKYREGYAAKLLGRVPERKSRKKCLWFHAVSVGEVNLLAPLFKEVRLHRPEWECVLSTTTTTGMALAKKKYPELTVFYCPLDFSWACAEAVRRIRPDALVLAELELWPNLIQAVKESGGKVAVINGRLGEKSFRGYRRIRRFVAGLLRQIDLIAVQDDTYAVRFRELGAMETALRVTGSMKYDGARTDRENPATRKLAALAGIAADDIVFLAGSTQEPEEEAVVEIFKTLLPTHPRLRLIIVPRHPERFDAVARLLDQSGVAWIRRTTLDQPPSESELTKKPPRVLLVDVVGELGAWWGTAHIAFVGGSFGQRGGQNMIEPAAYGAAVSFGPNTWNFKDIVSAMLARNAVVVVQNPTELLAFVRRCLDEPSYAGDLGKRARKLVFDQHGATEKTFYLLVGTVCTEKASAATEEKNS